MRVCEATKGNELCEIIGIHIQICCYNRRMILENKTSDIGMVLYPIRRNFLMMVVDSQLSDQAIEKFKSIKPF